VVALVAIVPPEPASIAKMLTTLVKSVTHAKLVTSVQTAKKRALITAKKVPAKQMASVRAKKGGTVKNAILNALLAVNRSSATKTPVTVSVRKVSMVNNAKILVMNTAKMDCAVLLVHANVRAASTWLTAQNSVLKVVITRDAINKPANV
jgi:hypothetical protein